MSNDPMGDDPMSDESKEPEEKEPKDGTLIWERPEPPARMAVTPLSRERIVGAAMDLADAEGLAAVSLRKVAAVLDARPMRLYGWLSTKEDLLDLMVDAVYGKMKLPRPSGDWRADLRTIAHDTRQIARRHLWFIELLSGRPHVGPNALRYLEATFSVFGDLPIDTVMRVAGTVNAYVIGAISAELAEERAERRSGMNEAQWHNAMSPYMTKVLGTGQFPMLTKVMLEATHPDTATAFAIGLDYVLDGIAVNMAR